MPMSVFKRVLAMATAAAAAGVFLVTPAAHAATPTTKDAAALAKDLAAGDLSALSDTTYRVTWENTASQQCLNQDYSGGVPHHDILAWACDDSASNEYWDITYDAGEGWWTFKNVASKQCLNQDYSGGVAHHDMLAWACDDSALNEKWYLDDNDFPGYWTIKNVRSGQVLNQDFSGGQANHDVLAWPYSYAAANALWIIGS
ncbi:RICIN domain-containing protein [Streptomyces sp. NPDC101175]|uniref:RICIN domain-containing protein n=1 Tax=Streptomyces sp. NPDC101175 TaxID=3366123 RepID=UPI0038324784